MVEIRNAYKFNLEDLKSRDNLEDLGIDGRTMIKFNLKTCYMRLRTEFKSLKNGWLL
jgi:hypothetical protein